MRQHTKKTNNLTHIRSIRTLCMLLFSLLITFGGWLFTKQLLKYKETQLLAKSGQLHVADFGYSLLQEDSSKADSQKDSGESDILYEESISEDLMAQILSCWESGSSLLSHEPKKGQISMEQAISAGNSWIAELAQKGLLPSYLSKKKPQNVNAALYTIDAKPDFPDYLLSRWIISYTVKDIDIALTIHAASGQIWQAGITAQSSQLLAPIYTNSEELLITAFPFITQSNSSVAVQNQTGSYQTKIISSNGKISAAAQWLMISTGSQTALTTMTLMLETVHK